jgi:hypothetical protein
MAGPIPRELLWDCPDEAVPDANDAGTAVPSGDWLARLVRTIEGEVVPRLMLAHRSEGTLVLPASSDRGGPPPDVESFVRYLLQHADIAELNRYVEAYRSRGATLDAIYLDLFAPAARRLGQMWEDDLCGFSEVTIGLCRLQQLVHQLSMAVIEERHPVEHGPRILLAVASREQHTFGLSVVGEFFRRAGWDIAFELSGSARELGYRVREERVDRLRVAPARGGGAAADRAARLLQSGGRPLAGRAAVRDAARSGRDTRSRRHRAGRTRCGPACTGLRRQRGRHPRQPEGTTLNPSTL